MEDEEIKEDEKGRDEVREIQDKISKNILPIIEKFVTEKGE